MTWHKVHAQVADYRLRPGRAGRANLISDSGFGVAVPLDGADPSAPSAPGVVAAEVATGPSSESIQAGVISLGSEVSSCQRGTTNATERERQFARPSQTFLRLERERAPF